MRLRRLIVTPLALGLIATACAGSGATTTTTMAPTTTTTTTSTTLPPTTTSTTMAPTTTTTEPVAAPCAIESPSPEFDTSFYAKQCTVLGIPVLSSAAVADAAHDEAARVIVGMLATRTDLIDEMLANGLRVGIIGRDELTTDLPEHSDLDTLFPKIDWDVRTRGAGGTLFIPLTSSAEENLLCLDSDVYRGESILVHEFAHTVRLLGIATAEPETDQAIEAAYRDAMAAALWVDTYAVTNSEEYWAEAVQSYFDTNASAMPPDGIHNDIDTNEDLSAYDPVIYAIIEDVFGNTAWRYRCP